MSSETGDLELLVETEKDDGPLVAIDTDGDSELVISTAPNVILEGDDGFEDPTLAEELEAKVEAGNASKRLERRMQRKNDREAQEIFDNMSKNLPPLPLPGQLPAPPAPGELPIPPGPKDLPQIDEKKLAELPPLPAPGELPMPPLPGAMPLPPIPAPERKITCQSCGAGITVRDMTLRKMDCPVCSEVIEM